jgi:hypothetical protein
MTLVIRASVDFEFCGTFASVRRLVFANGYAKIRGSAE